MGRRCHARAVHHPGALQGLRDLYRETAACVQGAGRALQRDDEGWVMTTPYASATGGSAREEITKILRRLGCESVGFMDDFEKHEVLLAFSHRGRPVQLRASAKGWAAMYLKENPYNARRKGTRLDYEQVVLRQ